MMFPCLYVLELEDSCWYVGITTNFNYRMAQHFSGQGAIWTKEHKPKRVFKVFYPATREMENEKTLQLIEKYGAEFVRGGSWTKLAVASRFNENTSDTSGKSNGKTAPHCQITDD